MSEGLTKGGSEMKRVRATGPRGDRSARRMWAMALGERSRLGSPRKCRGASTRPKLL